MRIFQTDNGGEIDDQLDPSGLESAAYLSLFGGNEDDDGRPNNPLRWWGGDYRSRTQYLLRSIPAVPANLRRIEDAARADLAWLGASVTVEATMPALNRVAIAVTIQDRGVTFTENWRAAE